MKLLIALLLVICLIDIYSQEVDLTKPLNEDTFREWDLYIKKYAPSEKAFNVVVNIATRHFYAGRAAVAHEVFSMYKALFPAFKVQIDNQLSMLEELMLSQTPQEDMNYLYVNYINKNSKTENGFIALQRLTDKYINSKQWDSAIVIYSGFKPLFPNFNARFEKIISILKAKEQGLRITNLGNIINTIYDEWDPTPTPDGKVLYFSSRNGKINYGNTDVYYSLLDSNSHWSAPNNVGRVVNGPNDETIDNVSVTGDKMMLSGDFEGSYGNFDIYTIERDNLGWGALTHLPKPINSEYTDEGAVISSDGKAMIFSSDRPGCIGDFHEYSKPFHGNSMGNMDLFVCLKSDSGWSAPINLGNVINTPYSERAPYLHPDGKTLYFSSDGHPGLGRLDLFKSVRLNDDSWTQWSEPVNLGKEINTANDDWGYNVSLSGDSAFYAANNRNDGYGGWDLYSISLPDSTKPEKVVTIHGRVIDNKGNPVYCTIKWENLTNGQLIGQQNTNPNTGYYFIVLPLGKNYGYYAEKQGYYPTSSNIDLRNTKSNVDIINDIVLKSEYEIFNLKAKIIINNIFFDYNKFELKTESSLELDRLVELIKKSNDKNVHIDGFTDNIGSDEFNMDLSQKRALAVKTYFVSKGLPENRLIIKGNGNKFPIKSNETEDGRKANRRVEISFSD